ncbi:MAG: aminotransferase class III-fold pyridoxal phosphate-dependent enzyme [Spirochaetes bacterium]|nr:aminotransferase class III-fold pyridoxal phosphate-dependent enzyme [Spirochaetota bacterium]
MKHRDHSNLLAALAAEYERHSPHSAALNRDALKHLVDGGSHTLRLIRPFPPRIVSARGAYVNDEDGHRILDFWQGHYANILGHNPEVVTRVLADGFKDGFGLQTGFTDRLQIEVADILCERTGAEKARFTSSGSLATMYATLLARAFTGRELVMKVGGGWHGAQPWGLVGVDFHEEARHAGRSRPGEEQGFSQPESRGLPSTVAGEVVVTRFNDAGMLADQFRRHGRHVACFIVEPFLGSAGSLPAAQEFLAAARELTRTHGALLIFDEVISGFRFRAGSLSHLYGVQPDLATFAKVMGGGMPVAAVAGRADVMALAGRGGGVKFSGGTYSCHPASLLAAKTMMSWLAEHEGEVYPRINSLGEKARRAIEEAFRSEGILARCTGDGNGVVPGSSMGAVSFPRDESIECCSPEQIRNPELCDVELSDTVLQLALLLEDVHVVHGLGSVSTAHTEEDIARLEEACRRVARRIRPHL